MDKFDNSGYSKDSAYFDPTKKTVIGKFKDEAAGMPIKEWKSFLGLRSKMYSYIKDNGGGGKTANYEQNYEQNYHKMKRIRSVKHEINSCEINKVSLSQFDDKRYIQENGVDSYAYGHRAILWTWLQHEHLNINT